MKRVLAIMLLVAAASGAYLGIRWASGDADMLTMVSTECGAASPLPFCVSLPGLERSGQQAPQGLQPAPACDAPERPAFCVMLPSAPLGDASAVPRGAQSACDRLVATGVPTFCLRAPDGALPTYAAEDRSAARTQLRTRLGDEVASSVRSRADLLLDTRLPARERTRIESDVDNAAASVEAALGRRFADRPLVLVIADPARVVKLLVADLGFAPSVASTLSRGASGLLLGGIDVIVLNVQQVGDLGIARVLRHELTHLLVRQLGGEGALPAWVDEGLASIIETAGTGSPTLRERVLAGRGVATGALTFARLTTSSDWVSASVSYGTLPYVVAAHGVRVLERDIGRESLLSLVEASRGGGGFERAYESHTRRAFAEFVASLPARIPEAACERAIRLEPRPGGVTWLASGLGRGTAVEVSVTGADYAVRYAAQANADGLIDGTFGSTAPRGVYVLSVRDARGELTIELRNDGSQGVASSCQ